MRRLLLAAAIFFGIYCSGAAAWATCAYKVNVVADFSNYEFIQKLVQPALTHATTQWQATGADITFGTQNINKTISVTAVDGCKIENPDYYVISTSPTNSTLVICMSHQDALYGSLPALWYSQPNAAVLIKGGMLQALGAALGIPFSGTATDAMYPKTFLYSGNILTPTSSDAAAAKGKFPLGSCTSTPANTPPQPSKPVAPGGKTPATAQDTDKDGVLNANDNCPKTPNSDQKDFDNDNIGDACDPDIDNDWLSNAEEAKLGTNPYLDDSDGDYLSDGNEVQTYQTDPKSKQGDKDKDGLTDADEIIKYQTDYKNPKGDKDNDGLTDADEVLKFKSNPTLADSDGDGIPDGKEIFFGTDPNNPKGDKDKDGLTDTEEFTIYNTILDDDDSDDDQLLDGEEVKTYKTNPLVKDDTDKDGLTNGKEIYETKTNPSDPDSDKDGLSDGQEVLGLNPKNWTSDPLKPDTDSDGISDSDEILGNNKFKNKSNPKAPDTDGDSLEDKVELAKWTDPNHVDTDADSINDGTDNCPIDDNTDQKDSDGDGTGDVCQQVCDQKCSNIKSCKDYEGKKKEALSLTCKLLEETKTIDFGTGNTWSCSKGEACFCALPIFLNTCVADQTACETQYCQKSDANKASYNKKMLTGECENIKKMGTILATGKNPVSPNAGSLLTTIITTFKYDGAFGLNKIKDAVAAQLGYYLGTEFTKDDVYKAHKTSAKLLIDSTGSEHLDWTSTDNGEVGRYESEVNLWGTSQRIVYNKPMFEMMAKKNKFDPLLVSNVGAHEAVHALITNLVNNKGIEKEDKIKIKTKFGVQPFDIVQHKIMKLLEFALASYTMAGTDDKEQDDISDNNFLTASEILKNKLKWQGYSCAPPGGG